MVDHLYAPWREEFILGPKENECIFCKPETRPKVADLILHRGEHCFVVLNRYPYNAGHLMVVPFRHCDKLHDLPDAERDELMALVSLSSRILTESLKPDGINVGMNIGRAGGAGIADHIHTHCVPRWVGDTNFMPVFSETRVVSIDLEKICEQLRQAFKDAI